MVRTLADYLAPIHFHWAVLLKIATEKKTAKYISLPENFSFEPVALETLGPINRTVI